MCMEQSIQIKGLGNSSGCITPLDRKACKVRIKRSGPKASRSERMKMLEAKRGEQLLRLRHEKKHEQKMQRFNEMNHPVKSRLSDQGE